MINIAAFIFAFVVVALVLELVRRKHFKEKYAALWLVVGIASLVLAGWPNLLNIVSSAIGVQVGSNFLFGMSFLLLIGVCLHLSWEQSVSEEEIRVLAEEVAILRSSVLALEEKASGTPSDAGQLLRSDTSPQAGVQQAPGH
ncbi:MULTISPECIES: DUF2304 domain-containing protein [unclassified Arthrobacter]|uniref:DUF2304 domain-containing protein n=1 Tax=unclassified Arthrobacter TaxID=235627 RepID=UPI001D138BF9|nr:MULTISPECIES: DUF2304 domain-containing protein [unclassified Arthrobacter]MCC3290484.1 DUF2304 domain-containing protein [Arthrobacter sp. zg-Y1110]MCC3300004.1 DUF2304 domain-containing protein [Arthrobacter sp. zg-Y895]UWX84151.1 DUF2304 domain-containing protein [Arthrobacter sp. zg-Y1110]